MIPDSGAEEAAFVGIADVKHYALRAQVLAKNAGFPADIVKALGDLAVVAEKVHETASSRMWAHKVR